MDLHKLFSYLPEVRKPEEKKLSFNVKLKWTVIILGIFFILSNIPLWGLSNNALERFEFLATILGADFGSLISLGIGPIVMASIILQLLVGAKILNIDTTTVEGKKFFQGLQKVMVLFFIVFEAAVYVLMGGLAPDPNYGLTGVLLLIFQLILGGLAILLMDEVTQKWGFGSGVSLFIAAGVSKQIIVSAFQFTTQNGRNCLADFQNTACPGQVFVLIQSIITQVPTELMLALATIVITVIIFLLVVWAQSLKVEIPLSFGRIRGYNIKWPLAFFYASVIPVILTAALVANVQLFGGMLQNSVGHPTILGNFVNGVPQCNSQGCGLAFWLSSTNLVELIIRGGVSPIFLLQGLTHILFFMGTAIIFSVFWVKTSGLDTKSQAEKIMASGLQVSGFRQDERVLETILDRYIMPLTVMGGAAIGLLASITNLFGALVSGTAILLVIMIMYQMYQNIAQQHAVDMHPAMRKFMGS
jgi:preprotein translocase subunit SecY